MLTFGQITTALLISLVCALLAYRLGIALYEDE